MRKGEFFASSSPTAVLQSPMKGPACPALGWHPLPELLAPALEVRPYELLSLWPASTAPGWPHPLRPHGRGGGPALVTEGGDVP